MSVRARWEWALRDTGGDRPSGPVFASRFDAEQWLGEHWRSLAAEGVERARLVHEGVAVGAELDLTPGRG